MKTNNQKGFIVPLLLGIIAVLVIGGAYIYTNKKLVEAPLVIDSILPALSNQTSTTTVQNTATAIRPVVTITLPISSSSYNVGDIINVKWTPASFSVKEIAIISENISNDDGTNKAVWGGYGGELEKVSPITNGEYKITIPKQIPDGNYKIRIISDYNKYTETSYFSEVFKIKGSTNLISDWKTYINIQYGFSFQYPSTWNVYDSNETVAGSITKYDVTHIDFSDTIKTDKNINTSSVILLDYQSLENCYGGGVIDPSKIEVKNNINFLHVMSSDYSGQRGEWSNLYVVKNSGHCYQVIVNMDWDKSLNGSSVLITYQETLEDYLNQIVSTFKFTN